MLELGLALGEAFLEGDLEAVAAEEPRNQERRPDMASLEVNASRRERVRRTRDDQEDFSAPIKRHWIYKSNGNKEGVREAGSTGVRICYRCSKPSCWAMPEFRYFQGWAWTSFGENHYPCSPLLGLLGLAPAWSGERAKISPISRFQGAEIGPVGR